MSATTAERAVEALHLAEADPARSVATATDVSRAARRDGDEAAASVAERALGIAALHLADTRLAALHLRRAVRHGRAAGQPALVAEARLRLAAVLNLAGRPRAALRELDAASGEPGAGDRARALAQRGAVLLQLGRLDEAVDSLGAAIPQLRAAGDRMWLKRALANRGIVEARRLRFAAAEADLSAALQLNRELGIDLSVAFIEQNLGWLHSLRGDVPRALNHLDRAEATLRRLGAQIGLLLEDRAALLLSVGLVEEAQSTAAEAVVALQRERQTIALPDVRLLLARTCLRAGDPAGALPHARRAAQELTRLGRPQGAALAAVTIAACRAAGAEQGQATPAPLERAADVLETAGWLTAAVEARLLAAELAARRSHGDAGAAQLLRASGFRRRGPAGLRALGWQAEALLRQRAGQPRAALTAVRAGLRALDEQRASFGAADLRAHSGGLRVDLATLGLRIAMESGRAAQLLVWAEHGRASHLNLPRLRPPEDEESARDLADLRAVSLEADRARAGGADLAAAVRRQATVERRIRDRARRLRVDDVDPGQHRPPTVQELSHELGGGALIEYVELDGLMHALCVVDGRVTRTPLGPVEQARSVVGRLPFALRRLAGAAQGGDALLALARAAGDRLDDILLKPVHERIADRPLVVVPSGPLQSLPWSLLPSCAGRPVTVAPSAVTWHAATTSRPGPGASAGDGRTHLTGQGGRVLVVAGPGLPGAQAEAESVARLHGVTALSGTAAAVAAVTEAMRGAELAHLAAHGSLHREHPLFSAVMLADGPLTAYDIERLDPVPRLVVLAGCDTGYQAVRAGDELLGLTATLLARGGRQVVGSVIPVPDAQTAALMTDFHAGLLRGLTAAEALATAQAAAMHQGPAAFAVAAGFVCVGGTFTMRSSD